ncbi:hypothetical protein [Nitrospira sp. Nam74]
MNERWNSVDRTTTVLPSEPQDCSRRAAPDTAARCRAITTAVITIQGDHPGHDVVTSAINFSG